MLVCGLQTGDKNHCKTILTTSKILLIRSSINGYELLTNDITMLFEFELKESHVLFRKETTIQASGKIQIYNTEASTTSLLK